MTYYFVEAEVAGVFGERTIADFSQHPPQVDRLHYEFDGWLGDQLVESFPCYLIADDLARDIADLTGYTLAPVEVSLSEKFHEVTAADQPSPMRSTWHWLRIDGSPGESDFAISSNHRLIVSARAMDRIARGVLHASIERLGDGGEA
jgi:hypothetical protein